MIFTQFLLSRIYWQVTHNHKRFGSFIVFVLNIWLFFSFFPWKVEYFFTPIMRKEHNSLNNVFDLTKEILHLAWSNYWDIYCRSLLLTFLIVLLLLMIMMIITTDIFYRIHSRIRDHLINTWHSRVGVPNSKLCKGRIAMENVSACRKIKRCCIKC